MHINQTSHTQNGTNWLFIIFIVLVIQIITFAFLFYDMQRTNITYFMQITACIEQIQATIANQQQFNELQFNNLKAQQLDLQILAENTAISSGIYTGNNEILKFLTSKPVLIVGAVIAGTLVVGTALYMLINNHSGTINDNIITFTRDFNEKLEDVNANLDTHVDNLERLAITSKANIDICNKNLCSLEGIVNHQKITLENTIQDSGDSVIHQIISFFSRKFGSGPGTYGKFPSVPPSITDSVRIDTLEHRLEDLNAFRVPDGSNATSNVVDSASIVTDAALNLANAAVSDASNTAVQVAVALANENVSETLQNLNNI